MTIQQMEYIVALNRYRHFVKAAEKCGVTQPTLSSMIQKLESELGVKIFDRSKLPVEPTLVGERIIRQAESAINEMNKIKEMIDNESTTLKGKLHIGIIPTLAPYIVPLFIKYFRKDYPDVELTISEETTNQLKSLLFKGNIDIMIAATPLEVPDFYEIPIYYERFVAYFSPLTPIDEHPLTANDLPRNNLWVLQEGHCMRKQTFNFCSNTTNYNHIYEAGSIDTLIRIVDENGGYSIIPQLHVPYLTERQKKNIRLIDNPPAIREISLIIRNDFIKERMINAVAETIKKIIPEDMLNERLKKFAIKL